MQNKTNFPAGPQIKKAIIYGTFVIIGEIIVIVTSFIIIFKWLNNNL